jgi:hypothetical protein
MTFPFPFSPLRRRFPLLPERDSRLIWEEGAAVELRDRELARLNSWNLRDLDSAVWDRRLGLLVKGRSNWETVLK